MKQYLETSRLILRDWKENDLAEFIRMNQDSHVMEYFLKKLSKEETVDFYNRICEEFDNCGYGLYAVETKEDQKFIGYVGLHNITFDVDFAPGIEIGWRLTPEVWGKGYATEAASACLAYANHILKIKKLYSFTSLPNKRSERVMQKIGMTKIKEFDHPLVETGHWLRRHVLYGIEFEDICYEQ